MASQGDPTRARGGTPPPAQPAPAEGVDFVTLLLSAIASAAAAYITSKVWGPGTLFSAAFAPVIVALVKEGLRRPTEKVVNVVPAVATVSRWSRTDAGDPGLVAEPDPVASPDVHRDPDAPHVVLPPVVPAGTTTPVRVYSTRARRLRWRVALITGLLGFGIAVVVFTVPELIAGQSLGGSHKTTIFGGRHGSTKSSTKTTTSTTATTTTATTPTQTETTATVTRTTTVTTPAPATTSTTTTQTPTTATPQQAPSSTAPPATAP